MKAILFLLFISFSLCYGQVPERFDEQTIANMEMAARQQQFNFTGTEARTAASDNFDVNYYRCEWELDPAVRYVKGKITVYFKMTSPSASIVLDMRNVLTADSVKYRGNTISSSQTPLTLQLNFPTPLNTGVLDSVSIWYQGVPANTGFGSFILSSHSGTPVMWSLSEAYGARDWWPCKNGINDKADSVDIIMTHASQYKAASNGLLQSEVAIAGNKTVTHWKHRYPIATYLICMAVTNYTVFNNSVQLGNVTLPMVTYCYPESLTAFQTNTFKVLEAMQLFNTTFGDYPFMKEKYGHVQFGFGGGMEHQTSTFVVNTDESLMAHELGHQWFGDKITCSSWEEIWLNEGFATHLAAYHMETKYPQTATANRRAVVNNITSQAAGAVKVDDTLNLGRVFSQRLSYNKGSHLLFMLRFIMGDQVFFKALRNYLNDPLLRYGNATTADLRRHLEAESGKNLGYFFEQWHVGQGFPSYNVKWSTVGSSNVNINISQTTSHPSVSFFRLPVALKFKNATQEKTIVVDNTFSGQTFLRNVGFVPDSVFVDPEVWLISRNNVTEKVPVVNTGAGIVDIYPNPVTDPFTIYLHDFNTNDASINIYNKAGQQVYSRNIALTGGAEFVQVPSSNWARGVYVIRIKVGDKTIVKQVLR